MANTNRHTFKKSQVPSGPGDSVTISNEKIADRLAEANEKMKNAANAIEKIAIKMGTLTENESAILQQITKTSQNSESFEAYVNRKEKKEAKSDEGGEKEGFLSGLKKTLTDLKSFSFGDMMTKKFGDMLSSVSPGSEGTSDKEGSAKSPSGLKGKRRPTINDMVRLDPEYSLGYIFLYNKLEDLFGKKQGEKPDAGQTVGKGIGGILGGIGAGIKGMFTGIAQGLENLGKDFGTKMKGVAVLIALAGAIGLSAIAFSLFTDKINWPQVLLGMGILLLFATGVALISKILNVESALKFALSIAVISGGLILAGIAFNLFNTVDWNQTLIGLAVMGGLAVVAGILGMAAPLIMAGSIAIGVLGLALLPFAGSLFLLSKVTGIQSILTELSGGLMSFAGLLPVIPILAALGIGLLPLTVGMLSIATGLALLSTLSGKVSSIFIELATGLKTFVGDKGLNLVDAGLLALIGTSLIPLGIGLALICPGLGLLSTISGKIGPLLTELGSGLTVFAANFKENDMKTLALLGAVFSALGVGMLVLAPGVMLMSAVGPKKLGDTLTSLGSGLNGLTSGLSPMSLLALLALGNVLLPLGTALILLAPGSVILPTLVDQFERLSEIDGNGLDTAAGGITAIAGALVAFGGSSLLSGIGKAIGEFFGGDPLKQFKEFAQIADPLKKAADAIDSMTRSIDKLGSPQTTGKMSAAGEALMELKKKASGNVLNGPNDRINLQDVFGTNLQNNGNGLTFKTVGDAIIKNDGTIVKIDPKDNVYVTTNDLMSRKAESTANPAEMGGSYEQMMDMFSQILDALKSLQPISETNIYREISTNGLLQQPSR
jgi:hypothetical protein